MLIDNTFFQTEVSETLYNQTDISSKKNKT